jgi:hypothetical protein
MVSTNEHVLDRSMASDLLGMNSTIISTTEEQLHPWRFSCRPSISVPLLRVWDSFSGSQPDEQDRMDSRAPRKRLDTIEDRRSSLAVHIDHSNWSPTPYISFTSSSTAVEDLARRRILKRGPQTLTVIDPNTRLRYGLPILDLDAEMNHYNIPNPYGEHGQYCVDHYICLWQVTEREIIGHWEWDELVASGNWYQDIVMPAFRDFVRRSAEKEKSSDLSVIMDRLCCKFLLLYCSIAKLTSKVDSEPAEKVNPLCKRPEIERENCLFVGDRDLDSDDEAWEDSYYNINDEGWDTDDEVEEANAADDMFKIIEGDW